MSLSALSFLSTPIAAAFLAAWAPASAQTVSIPLTDALLRADPEGGERFGGVLASDQGRVLVGFEEQAHLYDLATRSYLGEFLPSGALVFGYGIAVELDENKALVGANSSIFDGVRSGAAFLFDVETREERALLLPEDAAPDDRFGASVAMDGDLLVVGAPQDLFAFGNFGQGAAYVFDDQGVQVAKLVASDGVVGDRFGGAVAIRDGLVVVGANLHDEGRGAVYLFDAQSGAQLAKLVASDATDGDLFGSSVDLDADTIVVGAPLKTVVVNGQFGNGAAYLFDVDTLLERARLTSDGADGRRFGTSVRVEQGRVLVGGPEAGTSGEAACFLFDAETAETLAKIVDYEAGWDSFGEAVALDEGYVVIGHPLDSFNTAGTFVLNAGSVFVFGPLPEVGFRNDGSNPASFTSSLPWTNTTLRFTVDLSTTGHSSALVIGFDSPFWQTLGGGQTLLCLDVAGGGELFNTGFHDGPLAGIDLVVPNDPALVGLRVCTQAVHAFGVTPFALTNAQDLLFSGCPRAQEWEQKLLASDGQALDQFGNALAVSGNRLLVGAQATDGSGSSSGSAYLFDTDTGQELFELVAADPAAEDNFGSAVALDGTLAVAGAYLHDGAASNAGAAYVFDAPSGLQLHKLVASDAQVDDYLGFAVALDGDLLVAGAPGDDTNGPQAGAVYLFDARSGSELHKLLPAGGAAFDNFGGSVAIGEGVIVVGADSRLLGEDSAFLFDAATGEQLAELLPPGPALSLYADYGEAVAVGGGVVAVSSSEDDALGTNSGAVFLFDAVTGAYLSKLVSPAPMPSTFGSGLAMDGPHLVIGASADRLVHVYDVVTGQFERDLTAGCDAGVLSSFGPFVGISGDTIVVGCPMDGASGARAGSVLVF